MCYFLPSRHNLIDHCLSQLVSTVRLDGISSQVTGPQFEQKTNETPTLGGHCILWGDAQVLLTLETLHFQSQGRNDDFLTWTLQQTLTIHGNLFPGSSWMAQSVNTRKQESAGSLYQKQISHRI